MFQAPTTRVMSALKGSVRRRTTVATTPSTSRAKIRKNGRPSSEMRACSSDSVLAVTLKVGLRGLAITVASAGTRNTAWMNS